MPGVVVEVSGFTNAANNGQKTVAAVTATTVSVVEDTVDEVAVNGTLTVSGFVLIIADVIDPIRLF